MENITKNTTAKLSFSAGDYDAANDDGGLVLKKGTETLTFAAVEDPNDSSRFLATLTPAETDSLTQTGVWQWFARVTKDGDADNVTIVDRGQLYVNPDPTSNVDQRTQHEIDFEAVQAAIRAKIEGGAVEEFEIHTLSGRRRVKNMSLAELQQHSAWLRRQISIEKRAAGKGNTSNDRYRPIRPMLGTRAERRR